MNKFLGEQLRDFNAGTADQYRENWGTVLSFVHADPDLKTYQEGNNNSSINIFQKQMLAKEQQLLEEKTRLDAVKKQQSSSAMAAKF